MTKRMKITTLKQFEALVSEMERNPEYGKGFRKGIKPVNFDNNWQKIADKINSLGPPVRDGHGWHKVWKDLKFKVKKKLVTNKSEATATSGGACIQNPLSSLEEAVANLLQFKKQINPIIDVESSENEEIQDSIKGYLKDISLYQRKRLEIEEERLKIYKRKARKEEEILNLDVEIKKKKLKLLEKHLNLRN